MPFFSYTQEWHEWLISSSWGLIFNPSMMVEFKFQVLPKMERCCIHISLKADSHISCRAHVVPLPCRAAKGLECVFPIWFTQCGRVWFTLAMPCPCRAHAILWPCRSSQGHGTAWTLRDGLWATCQRLASSGYHAEFHKDCYQKHTNPPHNDQYLQL
jgi:hypothetical protein